MAEENTFYNNNRLSKLLKLFFSLLILSIIIFSIVIFSLHTLRALLYPYPLNYAEGYVMSFARFIHQYGNYFFNISDYPYMQASYPPVFPSMASLFIPLVGEKLIIGRVISLVSTLLTLIVLYIIFFNEFRKKYLSFILSTLFIIPWYVIEWATLFRVDILAIFFSVFGLFVYYSLYKKNSALRFMGIAFFILAFYTKQNSISAPLSIFLFLLLKDRRELKKFLLAYLIPLVSLFFYFDIKTHGQFYLHLVVYMSAQGFYFFNVIQEYQNFLKLFAVSFAFFLFDIIFHRKFLLYSLYFLVNFIFLLSIAKYGSGTHYYLEPTASILIIFGLVFTDLMKNNDKRHGFILSAVLLTQIFLLLSFDKFWNIVQYPLVPKIYEVSNVVNYYIKNSEGPVLSEDLGLLAINHLPVFYEAWGARLLHEKGFMDISRLIEDCNRGKFKLIVVGDYILKEMGLMACIESNYELLQTLDYTFEKGDYYNYNRMIYTLK